MSAQHVEAIHKAMPYFIDNIVVTDTFLAEFRPGNILNGDNIEDIMVNIYQYMCVFVS